MCPVVDEQGRKATRLISFIEEQRRHWERLSKGVVPEAKIINGWVESCDFAMDDLEILCKLALKGLKS